MNKPKILVVDDDPSNVELLETYLSHDHDVVTAYDGKEALLKAQNADPDLILLDVLMPGMNGFEVCTKLKNNEKTSNIPVLMVTALEEWNDHVKGINSGADDFLSKPIDFNELSLRTKSLLRIKQYHDKLELAKQELLEAVEEKYRNLFDNANDAIVIMDFEGRITSWNNAAQKVFGWTAEETMGKNWGSLMGLAGARDEYNNIIRKVINGDVVSGLELECLQKDGTRMDVSLTISPLKDADGNITGMSGIFRDITERKWAWKALQQSELKYKDLFENANDAIFILDSSLNYKDVNKKAMELTGYQREELLKMNVYDMIPPEQHMRFKHDFQKLSTFGFYEKFIRKLVRKDGRLLDVEVSSSAIKDGDKVIGSRDILRDITERKNYEEKIKTSLKEKELLLREIHHRVKNNMQVISSLLRLQSRHVNDEKYSKMFEESQMRIMSMALVHEKLYNSTNLTRINFKQYIKDLVHNLLKSYTTGNKVIKPITNLEDITLGIDSAIPCGLIISELVSNSLKHAFPDSTNGEIRISLRKNGDTCQLIVGDNGIGIPEEIDFRNTESLGLRLVTILTENQLNGELNLNRNKGTEFSITFK